VGLMRQNAELLHMFMELDDTDDAIMSPVHNLVFHILVA
jgi:hypothetical protein